MTLLEFIEARLTEDERVARRIESAWRCIAGTGEIVASDGTNAEVCAEAHWEGVGEHIVRHDPARVLRDVAALRSVVEDCRSAMDWADACAAEGNPASMHARHAGSLLGVLKTFAEVWRDHPDYDPTWSPT